MHGLCGMVFVCGVCNIHGKIELKNVYFGATFLKSIQFFYNVHFLWTFWRPCLCVKNVMYLEIVCVCVVCVHGVCVECVIFILCAYVWNVVCRPVTCMLRVNITCVLCAHVCLGVLGRSSRAHHKGCVSPALLFMEKRDFWKQQMVCSVQLQS